MIPTLSKEEFEIAELLFNPIALAECLFHDFDSMGIFDNEKLGHIRLYQYSLFSYEYLLANDPKLSDKANFKLREGAGNMYCLGGRKFGKTLCVEIIDILISILLLSGENVGFSSFDALHIRGVLEKVIQILELHPFFDKILEPRINRSPNYRIYLKSGYTLDSVNMNLASTEPGAQFFQKHFSRLYLEEASFETEKVQKKRIDAISENGCVYRFSGMTNFTKYSPAGQIFYDMNKRSWLVNYPQFVNPKWDYFEKERAIKEHGGEQSLSYRIFCKGEVVEEGISVMDMERVRSNYDETIQIKHLELQKAGIHNFHNILVVDKPKQTEVAFLCADIGETAPSEIIIIFKFAGKYRYAYNITLYNLTDKEQEKVFSWLIERLGINFVGIDTSEGTGRAIYRSLSEKFPSNQLIWCGFNEKIAVDFDKDEYGNVIFENGRPLYKEEFVSEWSIKHLKDLFYENKFIIPLDYKLDMQLNSLISMMSGQRTVYEVMAEEDHLLAAFRVFSIVEWNTEFLSSKPLMTKKFAKVGV